MKEKEVHLRVSMDLWRYLGELPDKTDYITNLINKDRSEQNDSKFIDSKIEYHQNEIKEWKEKKKLKPLNEDKIQELLEYHAPKYKLQAPNRPEFQRIRFLEKAIMPGLKKLGYKGSPQEIDEILINWPEAGL